jgi:hypothetical protein
VMLTQKANISRVVRGSVVDSVPFIVAVEKSQLLKCSY